MRRRGRALSRRGTADGKSFCRRRSGRAPALARRAVAVASGRHQRARASSWSTRRTRASRRRAAVERRARLRGHLHGPALTPMQAQRDRWTPRRACLPAGVEPILSEASSTSAGRLTPGRHRAPFQHNRGDCPRAPRQRESEARPTRCARGNSLQAWGPRRAGSMRSGVAWRPGSRLVSRSRPAGCTQARLCAVSPCPRRRASQHQARLQPPARCHPAGKRV